MSKKRSTNRDKALKLYLDCKGQITLAAIAKKLSCSPSQVSRWRKIDEWEKALRLSSSKGAELSSLLGNQNARKHGKYSKYAPNELLQIMDLIDDEEPADLVWMMIKMQFSTLWHGMQIMFVANKDDLTKETKRQTYETRGTAQTGYESYLTGQEFEVQFSWDKQAKFIQANYTAMSGLLRMINDFVAMTDKNDPRNLKARQMKLSLKHMKANIKHLEAKTNSINGNEGDLVEYDGFLEAIDAKEVNWDEE
ncbi:phage-related terminase small subunit, putative [Listeria seeligeri serovar 1/2b str. SLCC3954]|nr:phage-related terminase small subunit, putative [Listeria seeligeri serovar 1/2b str. SLCC3954]